jgi:head-tail adaptor
MFDVFFNSTIVYNTPTNTVDDDGTTTITYTAGATIPCSIHALNSSENVKYGRELSAVLAKLYIAIKSTDGTSLNPVHWGTFTWQGNTWRVIGATIVDPNGQGMQRLILERDI